VACLLASAVFVGAVFAAAEPNCVDHHIPPSDAKVDYGELGHPERPNSVLFVRLDDGSLRAEDAVTHAELWRYTPPSSLLDTGQPSPLGPARVLRFDANEDGVIDPLAGDRVWVFFGLWNRGRAYIALDASSRARANVLWIDRPDVLPHLGRTWALPALARLRFSNATQNREHLIVLLAGGIPGNAQVDAPEAGSEGNRIYAVDAATGALLWHAGAAFPDDIPDLELSRMTFGLASQIVPFQFDASGFASRLYAADTGGQIWRIDLADNRSAVEAAAGGRIASLGLAETPPVGGPDAREFFATPALALTAPPGRPPYISLTLGSGNALAIDSVSTQDRIYSLRDFNPFAPLDAAAFAAHRVLYDADLPRINGSDDSASLPSDAPGWKLDLRPDGEKVVAQGIVVNGVLLVPAFTPPAQSHECGEGTNRVVAMHVIDGHPALDLNDDGVVDAMDVSINLPQDTVAPAVQISSSIPSSNSSGSQNRELDALGREFTCTSGTDVLPHCPQPGAILRTWWRRDSVR